MNVYTKDCDIVGQDPKTIRRLAKRLRAVVSELEDLGLAIFGSEGSNLYIIDHHRTNPLGRSGPFGGGTAEPYVLASLEIGADGGVMQCRECSDGTHALCG
jgi:hypothetical protein